MIPLPSHPLLVAALATAIAAPPPSLLDAAAEAGRNGAAAIFQTGLETCLDEAEDELRLCLEEGRSNCNGVHEASVALCSARYPNAPPAARVPDRGLSAVQIMLMGASGAAVLLVLWLFVAVE